MQQKNKCDKLNLIIINSFKSANKAAPFNQSCEKIFYLNKTVPQRRMKLKKKLDKVLTQEIAPVKMRRLRFQLLSLFWNIRNTLLWHLASKAWNNHMRLLWLRIVIIIPFFILAASCSTTFRFWNNKNHIRYYSSLFQFQPTLGHNYLASSLNFDHGYKR